MCHTCKEAVAATPRSESESGEESWSRMTKTEGVSCSGQELSEQRNFQCVRAHGVGGHWLPSGCHTLPLKTEGHVLPQPARAAVCVSVICKFFRAGALLFI